MKVENNYASCLHRYQHLDKRDRFIRPPATVIRLALDGKFQLVMSNFIFAELSKNLVKKFSFSKEEVKRLENELRDIADVFETTGNIKVIDHKADNLILETAAIGKANVLVTGDAKHILPLKNYKGIKIVSAKEFLDYFVN